MDDWDTFFHRATIAACALKEGQKFQDVIGEFDNDPELLAKYLNIANRANKWVQMNKNR